MRVSISSPVWAFHSLIVLSAPLLATGTARKSLLGHQSAIYSVAIDPNGTTIASSGADNTIKLWNAQTGELIDTLTGHQNLVISLAFSPDGKTFGSGSLDGTIKIWQTTCELKK